MKTFIREFLGAVAIFILCGFCLFGCGSSKEENITNKVEEKLELNSGAFFRSEEGNYKLYNYEDGNYSGVDIKGFVLAYDKKSSNYICMEEQTAYIVKDNKKVKIEEDQFIGLKLSENGQYYSYFKEDDGLKLNVFNSSTNEKIDIDSKVAISGTLYDWYDENTIVYYGISEDGVNGIFSYNIPESKEELKYKIEEGFLSYLKVSNKDLVFMKSNFENKKELYILKSGNNNALVLSDKIEEIKDVILKGDEVYFTGRYKDNVESLYEISNGKVKRLVFDFPVSIIMDKKLSIDDSGNILFIGLSGNNASDEQVFSYSEDKVISALFKSGKDYVFVDYRS